MNQGDIVTIRPNGGQAFLARVEEVTPIFLKYTPGRMNIQTKTFYARENEPKVYMPWSSINHIREHVPNLTELA